jgi:hypothetical protein
MFILIRLVGRVLSIDPISGQDIDGKKHIKMIKVYNGNRNGNR